MVKMSISVIAEEIIKKSGAKVKLATLDFPVNGYISFDADKNRVKREVERNVVYDLRDMGRKHNVEINIKNLTISKVENLLDGTEFSGKVKVDIYSGVNVDNLKDSLEMTFDSINL